MSGFARTKGVLSCDGASLEDAAQRFGTPLYVYSAQSIREAYSAYDQAFGTTIPKGGWIVALCAFLFGYTTLIGWSYYGEQFLEHVFGARVTLPYRWVYCLLIPFGAVGRVEVVWAWGDLMNGLQVFPNMVGLLGLSGAVAVLARDKTRGSA